MQPIRDALAARLRHRQREFLRAQHLGGTMAILCGRSPIFALHFVRTIEIGPRPSAPSQGPGTPDSGVSPSRAHYRRGMYAPRTALASPFGLDRGAGFHCRQDLIKAVAGPPSVCSHGCCAACYSGMPLTNWWRHIFVVRDVGVADDEASWRHHVLMQHDEARQCGDVRSGVVVRGHEQVATFMTFRRFGYPCSLRSPL